ncbi:hypothetical protein [Streptomyces sp. 150FB]|uniref:hypothetical protein n=1 Tax=Streptomyces sp. 150FB TaxID=1576605 RepID=UPI000695E2E5|nr:hypothetical protein [Streptomyces sp. 150FB]
MQKITAMAATCLFTATLVSGTTQTAQAAAGPAWNKTVRCKGTDPSGRHIVTRIGNAQLGWNHFTHRHNIRVCKIINGAVTDKVDRNDHHGRLEYDGVAVENGGTPQRVRFTVIVQYSRLTKDRQYNAGKGQTIGVVNAYCRNQPNNKCPAWMNK